MSLWIGIDPGASGGCAILTDAGQVADVFAWTTATDAVACLRKTLEVDGNISPWTEVHALIEDVHAFPRQGVSSTFKFGRQYGEWLGILTTLGISFERVTPARWMAQLCLRGKRVDRLATKRKAQELFPGVRVTAALCDALLIAEVARRGGVRT